MWVLLGRNLSDQFITSSLRPLLVITWGGVGVRQGPRDVVNLGQLVHCAHNLLVTTLLVLKTSSI